MGHGVCTECSCETTSLGHSLPAILPNVMVQRSGKDAIAIKALGMRSCGTCKGQRRRSRWLGGVGERECIFRSIDLGLEGTLPHRCFPEGRGLDGRVSKPKECVFLDKLQEGGSHGGFGSVSNGNGLCGRKGEYHPPEQHFSSDNSCSPPAPPPPPVSKNQQYFATGPGDVCPFLPHSETHGQMNTEGLNLSSLGCSA